MEPDPQEGAAPLTLASRRRRLVAFLYDHFLFSMLAASAGFAMLGPRWDMTMDFGRSAVFPVFLVVMVLYFCKDLIGGQSIGRAIFGIAVRDAENREETPPGHRLIRRNLFLPIWPVELLALALSPSRQRIGDRLAETCVVRLHSPLRPRLLAGLGFAAALTGAFLATATHLVRTSAAYEVATAHLRSEPTIEAAIGRVERFGALPAGNIQVEDGIGHAELSLTVEGSRGAARVFVELGKQPKGDWVVEDVRIE